MNLLKSLIASVLLIVGLGLFSCNDNSNNIELEQCEHEVELWKKRTSDLVHETTENQKYFNYEYIEAKLINLGVSDSVADLFGSIAIKESGWGINNNSYSLVHKNPFCFKMIGFMKFDSYEQTLIFVKEWIELNPPKSNEDLFVWLQRREYCNDPGYYKQLKEVHEFKHKMEL